MYTSVLHRHTDTYTLTHTQPLTSTQTYSELAHVCECATGNGLGVMNNAYRTGRFFTVAYVDIQIIGSTGKQACEPKGFGENCSPFTEFKKKLRKIPILCRVNMT